MSTRILFLAASVQPFLASGIAALLRQYDVELLLLCRESDEAAPVVPDAHPRLNIIYYRQEPGRSLKTVAIGFKPDIVYCAGWMYPRYLAWCLRLKQQGAQTICAMDTQWKGSWKQQLLTLAAPLLLLPALTHAWVPGMRQETYARRLGFRSVLPLLCAPDTALWSQAYVPFSPATRIPELKTFLYIGRLEPHKLRNLLLAFRSLNAEERQGWQLRVIGNGSMNGDPLLQYPSIELSDFMPQQQLTAVAAGATVACLCSSDEPWGTVIQELAAAGLPLVVSRQCGAQPHFLTDGTNGFVCDGASTDSIRNALLRAISSSPESLAGMGRISHQLGISSNSDSWAAVIMSITRK